MYLVCDAMEDTKFLVQLNCCVHILYYSRKFIDSKHFTCYCKKINSIYPDGLFIFSSY